MLESLFHETLKTWVKSLRLFYMSFKHKRFVIIKLKTLITVFQSYFQVKFTYNVITFLKIYGNKPMSIIYKFKFLYHNYNIMNLT